jgi:hypothetical protein
MTIKADCWSTGDPTISVVYTTDATIATQLPAAGIDVESILGMIPPPPSSGDKLFESTNLGLEFTKAPAALLEILKPPPFLLEDFSENRFVVPADERSLMKTKYWLEIYQLLSMRQLICKATYTDNTKRSMQYTYTCAHDECHDSVTLSRFRSSGQLEKKEDFLPHSQELLLIPSFEHTCTPHCQWGTGPPSSAFKSQGFVMSSALRFTIVAQFLFQQVSDDSILKNTCSKDIAESEGLRLQMNRKLGLDVTKEQWEQTLRVVHRFFFSYHFFFARPVDRRDVNELTSWDLWRIYNDSKKLRSLFWFQFKVREEDATCMRWLKRIWLFTGFPILTIAKVILGLMIMYLLMGLCFLFFFGLPCSLCWLIAKQHRAKAAEAALYGRDGVEVTGHVSDRWVVTKGEGDKTYRVQLTYFEKDGTMCNKVLGESPGPDEYAESVPMLFLPDRPCSGIPTRLIQAEETING